MVDGMHEVTDMSRDDSKSRKFSYTTLGSVLGAILVVTASTASVQAAEDEDNDWYDVKILRGVMRGLGLRNGDEATIDYRERSPLVVPPSRDLPPPETDAVVERNPAWPVDPDVQKRKKAKAAVRSGATTAARQEYEDGQALRPDQLRRGTISSNGTPAAPGASNDDVTTGRAVKPSELGWTASVKDMLDVRGWFGGQKEEYAKFDGEPARATLTDPPVGYQTPSPAQPYGVGPNNEKAKAKTLEDRAEGVKQ
jgi:hypothetical protein